MRTALSHSKPRGAARVAVRALKENDIRGTGHDDEQDDEDEERDELLSLCSCLDGVISHLQKQVDTLKSYQRQPQENVEANWAVQSKIVDMYDVCAYVQVHKAALTLT